jgi:DNA-binding CsgD family transcriptional regulator
MKISLPLPKIASFLSLVCIFMGMQLTYALTDFLSPAPRGRMLWVYLLNFAGIVLGAVLCPLFLPLPQTISNGKPAERNMRPIGFILAVTLTHFGIRSLGVDAWLGSFGMIRFGMAVTAGMMYPMAAGLFFLIWTDGGIGAKQVCGENRTSRYCPLFFTIAFMGAVIARNYSMPLLKIADPYTAVAIVFNIVKWCFAGAGISAVMCIIPLTKDTASVNHLPSLQSLPVTDWKVIVRLVSLSAIFHFLNAGLESRLQPVLNLNPQAFRPFIPAVVIAVLLCALLSRRSMRRFFRWYLPAVAAAYILLACLPLFEEARFNMLMGTLASIVHFSMWVVFTAAVMEHYAGRFWFYGAAAVILFTNVSSIAGPILTSQFLPNGREYTVLFILVTAAIFTLLSFRVLFPKTLPQIPPPAMTEPVQKAGAPLNLENIFMERGLSKRERDVAELLVNEGLGAEETGIRLCISTATVKSHIASIYRKFEVKKRGEFMAMFVKCQITDNK